MANIVVTGGSGYIGQHFCKRLKETTDHTVLVVDNLSIGNTETPYCDKHYTSDVSKSDAVFKDNTVDAVVHFAASCDVAESVKNPSKYFNNNTKETLALLDIMVANNVNYLLFSSTCTVYGEQGIASKLCEGLGHFPTNPYGLSKSVSEKMIKTYSETYNIKSVVLRYFNAAGTSTDRKIGYDIHDTKLIPAAIRAMFESTKLNIYSTKQKVLTPGDTCVRDYIHVEDLVDAHLLVLEEQLQGNVELSYDNFNLGRGEGHATLDIVNELEKISGLTIQKEMCGFREGDPPILIANPSKFARRYKWKPKRHIKVILQSSIDWYNLNRKKQ